MEQNTDVDVDVDNQGGDCLAQFLSFTLGDEEYGVDILSVQEIRSWEPVSKIPNVPNYEKGVVNLRGDIVPIIDLRERFSVGKLYYNALTVVIILQCYIYGDHRKMGFVVDTVSDVVNANTDNIQEVLNFGTKVSTEFISGLIEINNQMLMILNVKKLFKLDGIEDTEERLNEK